MQFIRTISQTQKRVISTLFRVGISAGLLIWIISHLNIPELMATIKNFNLGMFAIAFIIWQLGIVQRTWRWKILLDGGEYKASFRKLLTLNYYALFFNTFLPTGFGGEVVRILTIEKQANMPRGYIGSLTLLDRVLGIITAALSAGIMLPYVWSVLPPLFANWVIAMGLVSIFVLILLVGKNRQVENRFRSTVIQNLIFAYQQVNSYVLIKALLVSFSHTVFIAYIHYLMSRAAGINISYWNFMIYTPLVTIAALMPSIQGLGVREGMYVLLLAGLNIPEYQALLVGTGANLLNLITGLLSGLVNLIWPFHKS